MSERRVGFTQLGPNLFRHRDTADAYLIRTGRTATAIDIGDGSVLDGLPEVGIDAITDVVMTHHHRDVAQGLHRAAATGARIWVPPVERDLFERIDEHWQARPLENYYDVREDRFSLLTEVPVAGVVDEYRERTYGGVRLLAMPTPGHTIGSVSYLTEFDGRRYAFLGDLLSAPGKVPSLASTQWAYNGLDGVVASIVSARDLLDESPDLLLPAHGDPIDEPKVALELLIARLQALLDTRIPEWQISELRFEPYVRISEHLLWNITSMSNSYVLLSGDGAALVIDYGYDFWPYVTGFEFPIGSDRATRRPWLQTIPALKRTYGIDRIEVALPSHYHDDHVAGFNLLREIEGAEVWSPANMTRIFREPRRFDLPCIWYDPIGVDRELAFGAPFRWREYEITAHELPGHTLYAAAYELEVDGRRVLATGDQQDFGFATEGRREFLGYNYKNRFRIDDYAASAELYLRLAPELMISGHWPPHVVEPGYLEANLEIGRELAGVHRDLLDLDEIDLGAEGIAARIEPYRPVVAAGETVELEVSVLNPFGRSESAIVRLIGPVGWEIDPPEHRLELVPHGRGEARFRVHPVAAGPIRRARIGADVMVGETPFGLQAEALIDVDVSRSQP